MTTAANQPIPSDLRVVGAGTFSVGHGGVLVESVEVWWGDDLIGRIHPTSLKHRLIAQSTINARIKQRFSSFDAASEFLLGEWTRPKYPAFISPHKPEWVEMVLPVSFEINACVADMSANHA